MEKKKEETETEMNLGQLDFGLSVLANNFKTNRHPNTKFGRQLPSPNMTSVAKF
jgi:hypothetical protein